MEIFTDNEILYYEKFMRSDAPPQKLEQLKIALSPEHKVLIVK